jgi:peptidoglycan DL-endopeptidase CwlO
VSSLLSSAWAARARTTVAGAAVATAIGLGMAAWAPGQADAAPQVLPKPTMPASVGMLPTTGQAASPVPAAKLPASIDAVNQRLDALARRNDQLVEKYDQAQVAYAKSKSAADQAEAAAQAAQRRLDDARAILGYSVAAQYEGGAFSATGALLASNSGASYLDQLDTESMVTAHNSQVVAGFASAQRAATATRLTAEELLANADKTRQTLAAQRRTTTAQIDKYRQVLSKLTAEQRAIIASRRRAAAARAARAARALQAGQPAQASQNVQTAQSVPTTPQAVAPSGSSTAAQTAVRFALAQVGKPYVFGAAGPDTYDCSGLTMSAWAAAGVSLPHSALQQYGYGAHVPLSDLQPGDLVFMYSPIAHVTIYIGNGLLVSAPEPGESVTVVKMSDFASDIVGATRPDA